MQNELQRMYWVQLVPHCPFAKHNRPNAYSMFTKSLQCFWRLFFHNHYSLSTEKSLKWSMTQKVMTSKLSIALILWHDRCLDSDFSFYAVGVAVYALAYLINHLPITLVHIVFDVIKVEGVIGRQIRWCWGLLKKPKPRTPRIVLSAAVCCLMWCFSFWRNKLPCLLPTARKATFSSIPR